MRSLPLFYLVACGTSAGPNDEPTASVPLDGRGGGVIAYCRQSASSNDIYGINADGTGNRILSDISSGDNHHPSWSPDARKIAVSGAAPLSTYSIYVMNADGSNRLRLTQTPGVLDVEPDWSPDGTQIVFSRRYPDQNDRHEIWIVDAQGGNPYWIGVQGQGDTVEWSPDGARLLYSSDASGGWDVYSSRTDGTDVRPLTHMHTESDMQPSWSSNGSQIVYVASTNGVNGVYAMRADGTQANLLLTTPFAASMPKWSPDGTLVAITTAPADQREHAEIFVVNSDGQNLRRVTTTQGTATSVDPDWRPAG